MLKAMHTPKVKKKCKNTIKGKIRIHLIIPGLNIIKIGIMIRKPNKKFIKFAIAIDMGMTSLGIINCLRTCALLSIEVVDSIMELIKKFQGKSALNTRIEKYFIPVFMTWEKIKVITSIINRGFIIDQEIPKVEPIYLPLKFFTTILLIICLCEIISDNLSAIFIIYLSVSPIYYKIVTYEF